MKQPQFWYNSRIQQPKDLGAVASTQQPVMVAATAVTESMATAAWRLHLMEDSSL
jgi:hypothetical protein